MSDILDPIKSMVLPDERNIRRKAESALIVARAITIDSSEMYATAAVELQAFKAQAKRLEDSRLELVDPLNKVIKAINARFKPAAEFFAEAEKIIKSAMLEWQDKVEKARAEREEAGRRATAERADATISDIVTAAAEVSAAPAPTKVSGISTAVSIDFEVTDKAALIRFVAANMGARPELEGLLSVDSVRMRAMVRALGEHLNIDGVRVFEKKTVRVA